jgi:hypothetical protein
MRYKFANLKNEQFLAKRASSQADRSMHDDGHLTSKGLEAEAIRAFHQALNSLST